MFEEGVYKSIIFDLTRVVLRKFRKKCMSHLTLFFYSRYLLSFMNWQWKDWFAFHISENKNVLIAKVLSKNVFLDVPFDEPDYL